LARVSAFLLWRGHDRIARGKTAASRGKVNLTVPLTRRIFGTSLGSARGRVRMEGNWQAAVFAAIKQAGIRQVGYVPKGARALLIQEMHAFEGRAAALPGVPSAP
jgi:hypothetical protein